MKFTFIIASVDRDAQLQDCVASIEKAHEHEPEIPIEILIIIQGRNKRDLKIKYPHLVSIYHIEGKGLSVARNFAIKNSSGDYYVFMDDDAAISEDFIKILSRKVLAHKDVNAFCGRLIDHVRNIPFSVLFYNKTPKKLRRVDFSYFMGSAHVLSAKAVERIGYYDERFGVGAKYYGSEEADVFFRLKAVREQVLYIPELVFFHPIPDNPPEYAYKYSYAVAAVLTKNFLDDKKYAPVYGYLIVERLIKAWMRILQELIFKGVYAEKNEKYHYRFVVDGTLSGIRDFIVQR